MPDRKPEGEERAQRQRPKGKGSIVKRGSKYYGRWIVEGKVYTKALKTSNREEANRRLAEEMKSFTLRDEAASLRNTIARLGDVNAQIERHYDEQSALSFDDAFTHFRGRAGKTGAATMEMYESQFNRLREWLAANAPEVKELRQLDRETAARFMSDVEGRFSGNTYNKYLALMRLVWRKLAGEIRAKQDPWAEFERREQGGGNGRRDLTPDELRRVFEATGGEMRLLFALGIYTGLRLGDCALLRWESIDMARRLIHVLPRKTAKTNRMVTVSIHPSLAALLEEARGGAEEGEAFVLPATAAQYSRDTSSLAIRIQRLFEEAGIATQREVPGYSRKVTLVGFHSLRHTFVSLCGNGGMSLAYVQSIVGHSNPMMTSHYFHADAEAHRAQLDAALPVLSNSPAATCRSDAEYDAVVAAAMRLPKPLRERLAHRLLGEK